MSATLTIAIPTYNRAPRLRKALEDLLLQIENSVQNKLDVSVFVSNNGSTDNTVSIIEDFENKFRNKGIEFHWASATENQGFDKNVLNCYKSCRGGYIWFLSDDDTIIDGVIPGILDDISDYRPNVLYYNFDQPPWTSGNPFLKESLFFGRFESKTLDSLRKIAKWPKLSSIVLKADLNYETLKLLNDINLGFMHVALACDIGIKRGRILHSTRFVARPDADYLDHVDFPPFVANDLYETLNLVLSEHKMIDLLESFEIKRVDPLTSSLIYLGAGYRGKIKIPVALKRKLYSVIHSQIHPLYLSWNQVIPLSIALGKFLLSYIYCIGKRIISFK